MWKTSFWVGILNVFLVLIVSQTAVNFMDVGLRAAVKNQMCIDKGCAEWVFRCGREQVSGRLVILGDHG